MIEAKETRTIEERAIALVKELMAGSTDYNSSYPGETLGEQFIAIAPNRETIEKADAFLHEINDAMPVVQIVTGDDKFGVSKDCYALRINGEMDSDEHETREAAKETRDELLAWNRGDR